MSGNYNQPFSTRRATRRFYAGVFMSAMEAPLVGYESWMDDDVEEGWADGSWEDDGDEYDDPVDGDDDFDYWDYDDDDGDFDCGFVEGVGCTMAGSEDCDFDCPYHDMNYG